MLNIPVGYEALIKQFGLSVIPHFRSSFIASKGRGSIKITNDKETHIYPKTYDINDHQNPFNHIEFALKYDGINLEILSKVFKQIEGSEFKSYIQQQPTGKYSRIIWFLYEFLSGNTLKVKDCKKVKYIDLLNPNEYFTLYGTKSIRHCINNNLIGNQEFCPIIRKTPILNDYLNKELEVKAKKITENYPPQIIARAIHYLYAKETMSSYEIERERPSKQRIARFIEVLRQSSLLDHLTKESLIELQNIIVDPRFKDFDYRGAQNYVGENINQFLQKIHYISPKPQDVNNLMEGLLKTLDKTQTSAINPVVIAAAISFGFVFIHPFEDGNGRIHRFLIHYILSKHSFTPPGIIFPISAVMLQKISEYDEVLESYSKNLLLNIDYQLSNEGVMTVKNETKSYYQYIDYTRFAEYLFKCIEETLHEHFEKEIVYLINYDKTKSKIQEIVDMPDKLIDLFISFVIQNNGELSEAKRKKYFEILNDNEIKELSVTVQKNMMGS
ncbi:MAG: Fic family protein [Proteobacteria bacterium]|nr:Fic family protein [Pseudomonadota bacterium]